MPKELLHWTAAAEAAKRLPHESSLRLLLDAHRNSYLLGAVLPDTLLHLLWGPYRETAFKLSDNFHAPPCNSYLPLYNFLRSRDNDPLSQGTIATLLGVASHIESDITFHPFVYSQAGSKIAVHYRIETELDLWLLHAGITPPALLFTDLLTEESYNCAATVISAIFDPADKLPLDAVRQSINNHGRFQGMYGKPLWIITARVLGLIPGTPAKGWQWLFYPFDWKKGKETEWPESWKDPSDNRIRNEGPEELFATSVERIARLLMAVEREGIISAIEKQPGENLLTGLPPAINC